MTTATQTTLLLTVGKQQIPVVSLADATARFQEIRDEQMAKGPGARFARSATVSGGYAISQNGRVWMGETLVLEADGSAPRLATCDRCGKTTNARDGKCGNCWEPLP